MKEHHDPSTAKEGRVAERRTAYDIHSGCPPTTAVYRFALAQHEKPSSQVSEATQDSSIATHIAQCVSCHKILGAAQRVLSEESDLHQGVMPELSSSINAYYRVDEIGETDGTMLDEFDAGDPDIQWIAEQDGVRIGRIYGYMSIVLVVDIGNTSASRAPTVTVQFDDRNADRFALLPGVVGNDMVLWPIRSSGGSGVNGDSVAKLSVRANGKSLETSLPQSSCLPGTRVLAVTLWNSDANAMWEKLADIDDRILIEYRGDRANAESTRFTTGHVPANSNEFGNASLSLAMRDRRSVGTEEVKPSSPALNKIPVVVQTKSNARFDGTMPTASSSEALLVQAPSVMGDEWEASVQFDTNEWSGCRAILRTANMFIAATTVRGNQAYWSGELVDGLLPKMNLAFYVFIERVGESE